MPPRKKARVSEFHLYGDDVEDPTQPEAESAYQDLHRHYEKVSGNLQESEAVASVPHSPTKKRSKLTASVEDVDDDDYPSDSRRLDNDNGGGMNHPSLDSNSVWLNELGMESSLWDQPEPVSTTESGSDSTPEEKKRKRTQADDPLKLFTARLDEYVDEMLRLEAFGDGESDGESERRCHGANCSAEVAEVLFRCRDCTPTATWCASCIVKDHTRVYLHRIERWTGRYFERCTLKSLGLRIQLGHVAGVPCSQRRAAFDDNFYIIDSDGVHPVGLDFCGCHQGSTPVQQLLRERLFPSTTIDPRTACTFRVLETFQMLSFTGKISAYEFLVAIFRRTDNTWNVTPHGRADQCGSLALKDRNSEFMRMVHEFRHLRGMKRGGRGHEPGGVGQTKEGELALLCPACPQVGINMPAKWASIPRARRWLFALFLAMDANFRLRRKEVSNDDRDPGFNRGYAYLVWETIFQAYIKIYGRTADEKSDCSNHDAIKSANSRGGRGIAASGLGAAQCSRHDMRRPMAAVDLQKGERYANMDYVMTSTLRSQPLIPKILNLSYDIGCQWIQHLMERCQRYPKNVFTGKHGYKVTCLVPKFHLAAHVASCQTDFSFNLTPGVGRTDGEAPERGWSLANRLAASTREMGPGNRRDTLDDNFGDLNWTKTVGMSHTLASRAVAAIAKRKEQVDAFRDFAAALPLISRKAWTLQVQEWEKDHESFNPYNNEQTVLTTASVRARLAEEDQKALTAGTIEAVHGNVSPSVFVLQGLEIEEAQRRLERDFGELSSGSTDIERTTVMERGNALYRRIEGWLMLQRLYAPQTVPLRDDSEDRDSSVLTPWKIPLYLPSDSAATVKAHDHRLLRYEFHFRIAQGESTLKSLRGMLLYQAHMENSKAMYASGTEANTRSNTLLQDISDRIGRDVAKYRKCRERLTRLWDALEGGDLSDLQSEKTWRQVLLPLEDADVAAVTSLDISGTGEGGRSLTWIWTVAGTGHDISEIANTALRIEFCRTRARAQRWQEECLLLGEEMRRVEKFFGWDAGRWRDRAERYTALVDAPTDPTLQPYQQWEVEDRKRTNRGKAAFAWRQAAMREAMQSKSREIHGDLIARLEMDSEIVECCT